MRKKLTFYKLCLIPMFLVIAVVSIYPLLRGMYLSTFQYDLYKNIIRFNGIDNYIKILQNKVFLLALGRNVIYVVITIIFSFIIGYIFALVFLNKFKGNKALRSFVVLPMLLIPVASGNLWKFLYLKDFGIINQVLELFHLNGLSWLSEPRFALLAIILTDVWSWSPWMFFILLAGLESLPNETLEAADIDGASYMQKLFHVVTPMMAPILFVAISLKSIDTFKTFDYVWVMTKGGPAGSSEILSTYIFKHAFSMMDYGYGSAMALVMFFVTAIFGLVFIFYYSKMYQE